MLLGYSNFNNLSFSNISDLESYDNHNDSKISLDEDLFSRENLDFDIKYSQCPTVSMGDFTFKGYNYNDNNIDLENQNNNEIRKCNSSEVKLIKKELSINNDHNKISQIYNENLKDGSTNKLSIDNLDNKPENNKEKLLKKEYKKSYNYIEDKLDVDKKYE